MHTITNTVKIINQPLFADWHDATQACFDLAQQEGAAVVVHGGAGFRVIPAADAETCIDLAGDLEILLAN